MAAYWQQVVDMNEYQKSRFTAKVIQSLFNTVSGKTVTILGFAFKKNTGDTRETPAIHVAKTLLDEGATLKIYDPKVEEEQIFYDLTHPSVCESPDAVKNAISIYQDAYSACEKSHAIVLCTEWDEFKVPLVFLIHIIFKFVAPFQTLDYNKIYEVMMKPAYIFDGRKILDHDVLMDIGFHVQTIGKTLQRPLLTRFYGGNTVLH